MMVGTGSKYLLQSIQAEFQGSFVNFLNGYRAEAGKRPILDVSRSMEVACSTQVPTTESAKRP